MALPKELNLFIARGTDNKLEFAITDESGAAVDISLDTVTFTARETFAGPIRISTISNAPGGHKDPVNGITEFDIDKTTIDDEALPTEDSKWKYEVRRVEAVTLDEFIHYQGNLIVKPAVTKV